MQHPRSDARPPNGTTRSLPKGWTVFYRIVKRIPRGRVTTYGAVALLAGKPRGARQVGYALAALRGSRHAIPWQRVLGACPRGFAMVSILDPMGAAVQRDLLEREGVRFDERGRVSLERFGWQRRRIGARFRSEDNPPATSADPLAAAAKPFETWVPSDLYKKLYVSGVSPDGGAAGLVGPQPPRCRRRRRR